MPFFKIPYMARQKQRQTQNYPRLGLHWVAVRELRLNHHNGCVYIYIYTNSYGFPNIVT